MRRNLRFWTRYTWESAGLELIVVGVLIFVSLMGASSLDHLWSLAAVLPYYLFLAAAFTILAINMGVQTLYIPMLLSFGETRRNVFLGYNCYRALVVVITLALSALIWAFTPVETAQLGFRGLPTMAVALVLVSSLSSLMSTIYIKWKWVGFAAIMLVAGSFGGAIGYFSTGGLQMEPSELRSLGELLTHLPWWLVLAAGIALALDLVFHWLLLRRREVKL